MYHRLKGSFVLFFKITDARRASRDYLFEEILLSLHYMTFYGNLHGNCFKDDIELRISTIPALNNFA